MQIYQSLAAPNHTAQWLKNLLLPVISACNFETPIPLEIRPCGVWGGFCESEKYINDKRVYLNSTKVFFWEKRRVVKS